MIKFFRGKKASYTYSSTLSSLFDDAIYFATDTNEILVNGEAYGIDTEKVKDVEFSSIDNTFTFTKADGSVVTASLGDKLLTDSDRTALDNVKEILESGELNVTYNTQLDESLKTIEKVGGIVAGTSVAQLKGRTITSVIDDLLFPTTQPTTSGPSVSIARKSGVVNLKEVGTTGWTESDFTVTPNRGQYTLAGQNKGYYAGEAGTPTITGIPAVTEYGAKTITASVTFAAGEKAQDNKGNESTIAAYPGGTKTATTIVYGAYPFFAKSMTDISEFTKLPLVLPTTATFEVNQSAEAGAEKHAFKLPSAHTITKIELYNTSAEKFQTIALTEFIKTTEDVDVNGVSVQYDVFTRNLGVNGAGRYQITYNK